MSDYEDLQVSREVIQDLTKEIVGLQSQLQQSQDRVKALEDEYENATRCAASMLMRSILDLLQEDPHQWSVRPCGTCRTISGLIGRPFGCNLKAEQALSEKGG